VLLPIPGGPVINKLFAKSMAWFPPGDEKTVLLLTVHGGNPREQAIYALGVNTGKIWLIE
jgi:hypothetical protein